jgi:hypothetical protein
MPKKTVTPAVFANKEYQRVDKNDPRVVFNSLMPEKSALLKMSEQALKKRTQQLIAIDTSAIRTALYDRLRGLESDLTEVPKT